MIKSKIIAIPTSMKDNSMAVNSLHLFKMCWSNWNMDWNSLNLLFSIFVF